MKNTIRLLLITLAGLTLGAGVAFAAEQLVGAGGVYWSRSLTLSANTTACLKTSSNASAKCALFPAGDVTGNWKNRNLGVFGATSDTIMCWSLDPGANIDTTKLELGSTERGNCVTVPTLPLTLSQKPSFADLQASAGSYTGICSIPIGGTADEAWLNGGAGDTIMYAPCSAAADCATNHGSSLSSATCTAWASATVTQIANVGAYALFESTGTPTIRGYKDRVRSF